MLQTSTLKRSAHLIMTFKMQSTTFSLEISHWATRRIDYRAYNAKRRLISSYDASQSRAAAYEGSPHSQPFSHKRHDE